MSFYLDQFSPRQSSRLLITTFLQRPSLPTTFQKPSLLTTFQKLLTDVRKVSRPDLGQINQATKHKNNHFILRNFLSFFEESQSIYFFVSPKSYFF